MPRIELTWNGPESGEIFFDLKSQVFSSEAVERKKKAWQWMFAHPCDRTSRGTQCLLVKRDGIAVAAQILLPAMLVVNGKLFNAVLPMSTLVHPEHRGAGLRLLKTGFSEEAASASVGLASNDRLMLFYEKLGGTLSPKRTLRRRVYRLGAVLRAFRSLPRPIARGIDSAASVPLGLLSLRHPRLTKNEKIEPIETFTHEFDDAWARVEGQISFALARKADFLNWRYVDMPICTYERAALRLEGVLIGYVVICIQRVNGLDVGRVTDIFAYDGAERTFALLLSWADRRFREVGCAHSEVSFGVNKALDKACSRCGFLLRKRTRPIASTIIKADDRAGLKEAMRTFHFCRGDHDEDY